MVYALFRKSTTGFTLVEIAIVLVISGLLIGAFLKSREMINNAKLKKLESDMSGILLSMSSYQDRYLNLPGDDAKAYDRFDIYNSLLPENVNGDGSGTIEGAWDANNSTTLTENSVQETEKFFAHLRAAGLISGSGRDTTRPTTAYSGKIGIQDGALKLAGHTAIFGVLDGSLAKILESHLDDGNPESGRVQADIVQEIMQSGNSSTSTSYKDNLVYNIAFRL